MSAVATDVELCNLALGHLGEQRINSLSDTDPVSRACERYYEPTLHDVLRAHDWNFAGKRVEIEKDGTDPEFGWGYRFALPADYEYLRTYNHTIHRGSAPHAIENGFLLGNEEPAQITYTFYQNDPTAWDSNFVKAFGTLLAAQLTTVITGSRNRSELLTEYEAILKPLAQRRDGNENEKRPAYLNPASSGLFRARFSSRRTYSKR